MADRRSQPSTRGASTAPDTYQINTSDEHLKAFALTDPIVSAFALCVATRAPFPSDRIRFIRSAVSKCLENGMNSEAAMLAVTTPSNRVYYPSDQAIPPVLSSKDHDYTNLPKNDREYARTCWNFFRTSAFDTRSFELAFTPSDFGGALRDATIKIVKNVEERCQLRVAARTIDGGTVGFLAVRVCLPYVVRVSVLSKVWNVIYVY